MDLLRLLQRCSPDALLLCAAELVEWYCVCERVYLVLVVVLCAAELVVCVSVFIW
jgi:hypothetical protein